MRVPTNQSPSAPRANNDNNNISISSTASLHITLTVPPLPTARHHRHSLRHTPVLLPSGVISTSPPYRASSSAQPAFVPHRPTFPQPRLSEDTRRTEDAESARSEDKERWRHAALTAHLSAELREDSGQWMDMAKECRAGRGGYQGPR